MYELKEPYEIWEKKIELRVKMAESGKGRQMVWRGPCISSSSLNLSKLKSDSASHAPWEGDKAVPNCLVGEMMAMDVEADTGQRKTKWKHLARGIYMLG
ncbi:hypothetical protein ACOSP7_022031 [Xanthoceras sorbifolium]